MPGVMECKHRPPNDASPVHALLWCDMQHCVLVHDHVTKHTTTTTPASQPDLGKIYCNEEIGALQSLHELQFSTQCLKRCKCEWLVILSARGRGLNGVGAAAKG